MSEPIQIVIIASTPALRAGLRAMLDAQDILILETLAAPTQLQRAADVLVLSDPALLPELGRALSADMLPGVLLLSDDLQPVSELRDMALRGWGLLLRESEPEELQAALRSIAQGLVVLARPLATSISDVHQPALTFEQGPELLTTREQEVLTSLSQGLANKQIARQLSISEHTVKFHISAILAKLGASSRTDAVRLALRRGMITL